LGSGRRRDLVLRVLEATRRNYQLLVVGYVVNCHCPPFAPCKGAPSAFAANENSSEDSSFRAT
jgi:hypothetical protein